MVTQSSLLGSRVALGLLGAVSRLKEQFGGSFAAFGCQGSSILLVVAPWRLNGSVWAVPRAKVVDDGEPMAFSPRRPYLVDVPKRLYTLAHDALLLPQLWVCRSNRLIRN